MWRRASSKIHKNDQIGVQMTVESSDDDVDDHHDVEYKLDDAADAICKQFTHSLNLLRVKKSNKRLLIIVIIIQPCSFSMTIGYLNPNPAAFLGCANNTGTK
jgi:hypothetical protein